MATPMPQICHHRRAACSHSRMPVITRLPAALGQETAAMRKGAAVGAGPVSERQPPRIHASRGHPSPRPTAPRRIAGLCPADGAAATGVGVGDRGGRVRGRFWSGAWSGNAGSELPLMDFFGRLVAIVFVLVRSLSPPRPPPPRLAAAAAVVVVVVVLLLSLSLSLSLSRICVCIYLHIPFPLNPNPLDRIEAVRGPFS